MKPANLNGNISIFDFAFLDLHMPVLDGFQTIEKLRDLQRTHKIDLKSTKIIAHSALTHR